MVATAAVATAAAAMAEAAMAEAVMAEAVMAEAMVAVDLAAEAMVVDMAAEATAVDMAAEATAVDMAAEATAVDMVAAITEGRDRPINDPIIFIMPLAKRTAVVGVVVLGSVLSGCASHRKPSADGDQPKRVCEATMIGSQPKTFCY